MINLKTDLFFINLQRASKKSPAENSRKIDPAPREEIYRENTMREPIQKERERVEDKSFSRTFEDVKEESRSNKSDNDSKMEHQKSENSTAKKAENMEKPVKEKDDSLPAEKRSENINEANTESSKVTVEAELKPVTDDKSEGKTDALKVLVNAINKIVKKLDLKVNLAEGLSHVDLENPSEEVLEQLSEIVFTLKEITSLLATAGEKNVALDMNGVTLEPLEASQLEKALRVDLFRIELAISSLGLSGEVSQSVAVKQEKPIVGGGIPQAVDPANLSMPTEQIKQILGDSLEAEETKIENVLEKIKELAKQKPVSQVKSETNVHYQAAAESHDSDQKKADVSNFDSSVMRRLLKVDSQVVEPKSKYDNKTGLESKLEPVIIHNTAHKPTPLKGEILSAKSAEVFREIFKSGNESDSSVSGITSRNSLAFQNLKSASASTPFRNPEQLVMNQVNQRFHYAVKNGINEMRLALRPESLGKVDITIQMESEVVTARISVENQQVKQIIESNLQQLKNALEEQNLTAGNFDVNVNQGSKDSGEQADFAGNDHNKNGVTKSASESAEEYSFESTGKETGRRFGSNTVEYFG